MRRLLLVALALTCLAVPTASASGALVVRVDALALSARDDGRFLCVDLDVDGAVGGESCACSPLRDAAEGAVVAQAQRSSTGIALGGAVTAAAARVDVVLADGRRLTTPTVGAGGYHGRLAQRVRFFLLAVPGGSAPLSYLRAVDAGGAVVGVRDLTEDEGTPPPAAARLGRLRSPSGRSVPLRAYRAGRLSPSLADLEHVEQQLCVRLGARQPQCIDPQIAVGPNVSDVSASCGETTIAGILRPGQRSVTAVLGDGRRLPALVRTVPRALTGGPTLRAYGLIAPVGVAVRRLEVPGSAPVVLHSPPSTATCQGSLGSVSLIYGFAQGSGGPAHLAAPAQALPTPLSGVSLALADTQDGGLCARLDARAPRVGDCQVLDRSGAATLATQRAAQPGRAFAVVTDRRIDQVTIVLRDGRRLPTAEAGLGAYTGAYAGRVRAFVARGPDATRMRGFVLRRAGKVVVDTVPRVRVSAPVRVLSLLGPDDLWLHDSTALFPGGDRTRLRCLGFTKANPSSFDDPCVDLPLRPSSLQQVFVHVGCATRRPVVLAVLPRGARAAVATLAGRRTVALRILRLPGGVRVGVIVLARGDALRSVTVAAREAVPLGLPPGRAQCGYDDEA